MKTLSTFKGPIYRAQSKSLKAALFALIMLFAWGCGDDSVIEKKSPAPQSTTNDDFAIADFSTDDLTYDRISEEGRISCKPVPRYNLNVFLVGARRRAIGFIKFRQFESEKQMIHLYTWIVGLEPNTSYQLQRAVDTTVDGNCPDTPWLTLGEGLSPKSIVTDKHGNGYAELFRSVSAIPVETPFDIHFQNYKRNDDNRSIKQRLL
ncbi:MAG: hypothetical protein ABI477_00650 [Chryseolinea sp.]